MKLIRSKEAEVGEKWVGGCGDTGELIRVLSKFPKHSILFWVEDPDGIGFTAGIEEIEEREDRDEIFITLQG